MFSWVKRIFLALLLTASVALWKQNQALQEQVAGLEAEKTALLAVQKADREAQALREDLQKEAVNAAEEKQNALDAIAGQEAVDAAACDADFVRALVRVLYGEAAPRPDPAAQPAGRLPAAPAAGGHHAKP